MELNKEIIPKFIEAMNHKIQRRQKWLSDEALKFLSQLGTWNIK
jgi:hypothetical protein